MTPLNIGYLDCFSGASGDMLVGALVDAGWTETALREIAERFPIERRQIRVETVQKGGLHATKVSFDVASETPARHLGDLLTLLDRAALEPTVTQVSARILQRLAEAEAAIHAIPIADVHFHELSGLDTVLDIASTAAGLHALHIDQLYTSPLNVGSGTVRIAHGIVPVPAPATARLLRGFSLYGAGEPGERVTPTAAAILAELAQPSPALPAMRLTAAGYGAGTKEFSSPNFVRLLVGVAADGDTVQRLLLLDCNIDDMNPEYYSHILDRLLEAGARDVFITPIVMKKGRPASMLSVLCHPAQKPSLLAIVFDETTTLGVRESWVTRHALARHVVTVQTPHGPIRVKLAHRPGGRVTCSPEYEDCHGAATRAGVPLWEVYAAATTAAATAATTAAAASTRDEQLVRPSDAAT